MSEPVEGVPPEPWRRAPCSSARAQNWPIAVVIPVIIALNYIPFVVWNLQRGCLLGLNIVLIVVWHFLLGMLVCAWVNTCITDPGVPPEWWQRQMVREQSPDVRICRKSGLYKPPRSHFCSVTKRLTLNMDHFCPWVVNTVGFYNRKFFLLFLLYTTTALFFTVVVLAPQLPGMYRWANSEADAGRWFPGIMNVAVLIALFVVDMVLLILLVPFNWMHFRMAALNQTTIDGDRLPQYHIGVRRNLQQVLGRRTVYWLLPCYCDGPDGDGVHWPYRDAATGAVVVPAHAPKATASTPTSSTADAPPATPSAPAPVAPMPAAPSAGACDGAVRAGATELTPVGNEAA